MSEVILDSSAASVLTANKIWLQANVGVDKY